MNNLFHFSLILYFVVYTSAKKLPDYIKKCSISSNDFDTCFVQNANDAIPHLLEGDKDYNIPSFNPLEFKKIQLNPMGTLKIIFSNIKIRGFDQAKMLFGHYDKVEKEFSYKLIIPNFDVKSNYEAKGFILFFPFNGKGTNRIQLKNLLFTHTFQLSPSDINSKEFLTLVSSDIDYTIDKTTYQFDNLFNGNKELGDQLNSFLNENEADLSNDFQPVVKNTINSVFKRIINKLLRNLRFEDLFLP